MAMDNRTPIDQELRNGHRFSVAEQEMVKEFHDLFEHKVGAHPHIPADLIYLRSRLIEEELEELRAAHEAGDVVEVADALGDLLYVVYGAAVSYGIDLGPIFREIHRSNMSKGDPEVIRRPDGKTLKGANWSPPSLRPLLEAQGL